MAKLAVRLATGALPLTFTYQWRNCWNKFGGSTINIIQYVFLLNMYVLECTSHLVWFHRCPTHALVSSLSTHMVQLAWFETTLCNSKFTQSEYDGQMVLEFSDRSYVCYLFLFFRKSSVNHASSLAMTPPGSTSLCERCFPPWPCVGSSSICGDLRLSSAVLLWLPWRAVVIH